MNPYKLTYSILLVLSLTLFTGCIEIIEEITIHQDQSATVKYRLETARTGTFFGGLSGLIDVPMDEQLKQETLKLVHQLERQKGISNIEYNLNSRSGEYYLQFDFERSGDLNNALYAIGGSRKSHFAPGYLKVRKNSLKKINFSPWIKRYMEREDIEKPSSLITDNIYFKTLVHTPQPVRRVSCKGNCNKKSGEMVVQRFQLTDIIENTANTRIKVRY